MKYILIIILFCTEQLCAQNKIYDLQLNTLDNEAIALKDYSGKKMLVATGDPGYLQKTGIDFLDSIQNAHPGLQVMVIPVQDTLSDKNEEELTAIRDNRTKRSMVLTPSFVSDKKTEKQHGLLRYLIDVKENTHFDNEVKTDFTVYVINESGILYAVLNGPFSMRLLNEVLQEKEIKQ